MKNANLPVGLQGRVCGTTACYPGVSHNQAVAQIVAGTTVEPMLGALSGEHVQLCPQNVGRIDETQARRLRDEFPGTALRLHANVHVAPKRSMAAASGFSEATVEYFRSLARVSQALGAPAYTLHAGHRQCSLEQLRSNVLEIEELFGVPVGVEGHYPERGDADRWLISNWHEYRWLLDSGLKYALDLSHLNIVARASGRRDAAFLREMLSSQCCIEVHLSDNNGVGDDHETLDSAPWWFELLDAVNPSAVVFSEGNQRRHRRREVTALGLEPDTERHG